MSTWAKLLIAAVALGLAAAGGAYKMHEHDQIALDKVKQEFSLFKGGVSALGEKAEGDAKLKTEADKALKKRIDDEHKRVVAGLVADIKRMRDERDRARGSFTPAAPAGAVRPDLACFDRVALESALRELVAEVRSLVDEGAAATLDLNAAKAWNLERK